MPRAARRFPEAKAEILRDAYALTWSAFDTWMEEDEVVYTHPRSRFVRVDALASSRHVTVRLNGAIVAESHRPVVLSRPVSFRATTFHELTCGWTG